MCLSLECDLYSWIHYCVFSCLKDLQTSRSPRPLCVLATTCMCKCACVCVWGCFCSIGWIQHGLSTVFVCRVCFSKQQSCKLHLSFCVCKGCRRSHCVTSWPVPTLQFKAVGHLFSAEPPNPPWLTLPPLLLMHKQPRQASPSFPPSTYNQTPLALGDNLFSCSASLRSPHPPTSASTVTFPQANEYFFSNTFGSFLFHSRLF